MTGEKEKGDRGSGVCVGALSLGGKEPRIFDVQFLTFQLLQREICFIFQNSQ